MTICSDTLEQASARRRGRRALTALALLAAVLRAGAAEVTITAREFTLEPGTVTVDQNEHVRIRLENMGVLAHNIAIPALDQATDTIQADADAVLELTAPAPGRYEIVCTVPGHEEAGMRATLRVR